MKTQLEQYIDVTGRKIKVGNRDFEVLGISCDGDIAVGTFKTARATYTGVWCNHTKVIGAPGSEVWSILGNGKAREVAGFAVYEGKIKPVI